MGWEVSHLHWHRGKTLQALDPLHAMNNVIPESAAADIRNPLFFIELNPHNLICARMEITGFLHHADLPAPLGDTEQCPAPAGAKPDESGNYIEAFSCQP